jgi:aminoglycoside 3-N-acetyltransferase
MASPHTPGALRAALAELGIAAGQTIMLHASAKAVGAVMGGPNTIVQALLDILTPDGTLMMYVGWQDIPDFLHELDAPEAETYRQHHPPFDPATARAVRDHGILAECVRTWPGAQRSLNAEASMVAIGARAEWLTRDHPKDFGYGAGSPLAKLIEVRGKVLLLGAPLDTVTLLHHAENRARIRHKAQVRYEIPVWRDGHVVWITVEDFDTGDPLDDYTLEQIARAFLDAGGGRRGVVGHAQSHLFDAFDLNRFAVDWLEARFGQ